jgi:flagellar export protein FliJ
MSFHFTLNGLLRLRESLERAELQRLQAAAAAAALARAEIEALEKDIDTVRRRTSETMAASGLTGAELHFEMAKEVTLNALLAEVLKRLSELEQKRREQQERYIQARMQREILTNLYKRKLAEYELDQSRRAQQRVDELFLIRSISSVKETDPA